MTTFAVSDNSQLLDSVNYLLSNLNQTGNANVVIPGNVLTANTTTGIIQTYGSNTVPPTWFAYQWVNLRYATNATGSQNFSSSPTNATYFGIYNSETATPSANPAAYTWTEVAGGFGTTKTIYYSSIGGRRQQWVASASSPSSDFVESTPDVAINLDIVTTAAGTPGTRGPIAMAYVVTPSDPTVATSATLTTWFEAPRTNVVAPIGTGLAPPVTGDTASFTWVAGPGAPTVTYSYNGSIWVPVTGQVISGNVIITGTLAGNAIIAGTITGDRIAGDTITGNKIAGNTITGNLIVASTITGDKISGNTITGNLIQGNTIQGTSLVIGTVTGNRIANGAIDTAQVANGAITDTLIAATTITGGKIATGTITATNIAAGTITATQIAANTITAGQIAANTITAGQIAAATITSEKIQSNTITANNIATGTLTTQNFTANTINGAVILSGSISTDKLTANAITVNTVISNNATFLSNTSVGFWMDGTSGNARFGSSLSVGDLLQVGGNATIGNNLSVGANATISGLLTTGSINANVIGSTQIAANAVTSNKIAAAAVTGAALASQAVTATAIANNTITALQIASQTISNTQIALKTINAAQISDSTITGTLIANNTITGNLIALSAITGNLIASGTITANNIAASTITANNIAANTITANNIAANTITATQISSAYVYAGNIISTNGVLGNYTSPGYWLRYTDGDARFGGNVNIGGNVTVGNVILAGSLANSIVTYDNLTPGLVPNPAGSISITATPRAFSGSTGWSETTVNWYDLVLASVTLPYSSAYGVAGAANPRFNLTFASNIAFTAGTAGTSFPYVQYYYKTLVPAGGNALPGASYTSLGSAVLLTGTTNFSGVVAPPVNQISLPVASWSPTTSVIVGVALFASIVPAFAITGNVLSTTFTVANA
jgi:osmotically-inducible protein OsmY